MIGRLALLGVVLAAMPLAVDVPGPADSSHGTPLQVEVVGGRGQYAFITRGCNGEEINETNRQLRSGALTVEQRLQHDFVIGVRAGDVEATRGGTPLVSDPALPPNPNKPLVSNVYINPYVGSEIHGAGFGVGLLMADHRFGPGAGGAHVMPTFHLRMGAKEGHVTLRWMEDVPLESEGHFSADFTVRPAPVVEVGAFMGLNGPYDGAMIGLHGRVWVTPDAALQIKASKGDNSEYGVYGGATVRLGKGH